MEHEDFDTVAQRNAGGLAGGPLAASDEILQRVHAMNTRPTARAIGSLKPVSITHLDRLEPEAIHILREDVATFKKSSMLYSVGKGSSVMLHLAMKAFYPSNPLFPYLHVDT
ncbi:sulfate adenylyltransferase subunit 2 [Rhizobium mongolense]|uniref:Sulfate adenylyltransferase subunit 2 n=1 Tax=Rhizobium mongolense TaxID=57676 RepID=A0ABR6J0W9_9HYPH|nr:sulfate adenylyltransferase subunit 2 [Rhizobium mongolense]